jgi:hypothetical protein
VVSAAGVMLVATLAQRLGIEALAGDLVRLRGDRAGAANAGRKVMALIFAMVLGADCIDDTGVLRAGRTRRLLGGWVPAPSTGWRHHRRGIQRLMFVAIREARELSATRLVRRCADHTPASNSAAPSGRACAEHRSAQAHP